MKPSGVDLISGREKQPTGLDFLYSIFQLYLAKHDPEQKKSTQYNDFSRQSIFTDFKSHGQKE